MWRVTAPWFSFAHLLCLASHAALICQILTLQVVRLHCSHVLNILTFLLVAIRDFIPDPSYYLVCCLINYVHEENFLLSLILYLPGFFPLNKEDLIRILSCLHLLCLLSHLILTSPLETHWLKVCQGKLVPIVWLEHRGFSEEAVQRHTCKVKNK